MALLGSCLSTFSNAQTTPLEIPPATEYPGILQTLEKLIEVDARIVSTKQELLQKKSKINPSLDGATNLELDPDFINSIILHSTSGYIRLASADKCQFYNVLVNDLLKYGKGKINDFFIVYTNKRGLADSGLLSRQEFVTKFIPRECPGTMNLINEFQIKTLDKALAEINFETPSNPNHCSNILTGWIKNPKTPYLCKIHELLGEADLPASNIKIQNQRQAIAKILDQKLTQAQQDYLNNLCTNLDDEFKFCEEFRNVSVWNKLVSNPDGKSNLEKFCGPLNSKPLFKKCAQRLNQEPEICHYPQDNDGLIPAPACDALSSALNQSNLKANYGDCPSSSDQQGVTNYGRILNHFSKIETSSFNGVCSSISSGTFLKFNETSNNDEIWTLEACYDDRLRDREVCYKTFFGDYNNDPKSYNNVVATILKNTRGADPNTKCIMLADDAYNPLLLQYKSGCFIIFEKKSCFISECKHKIIFNDREIDFVKIKNKVEFDYFPNNIKDERYAISYVLGNSRKKNAIPVNNLTGANNFFKRSPLGVLHGIGCAEDILGHFFNSVTMNECTPLPFIASGLITEDGNSSLIIRTGIDSLQAPRIISWSLIYSSVKNYQRLHPLKTWTFYALD
jgi:hypothetical protein